MIGTQPSHAQLSRYVYQPPAPFIKSEPVIFMNAEAPLYSAIVGCGPSGCLVVSLLKQSSAKSRLIAVDESKEVLDESKADIMITARPGEKVPGEIGTFEMFLSCLTLRSPA